MSKVTISKTSDDGIKVETLTVKDVPPELLKALGVFERMTDRANEERPEVDAEQVYAEALAKAMAFEDMAAQLRAMDRMTPNSLRIDVDTYNEKLTNGALWMTNQAVYARQDFNKIKEG